MDKNKQAQSHAFVTNEKVTMPFTGSDPVYLAHMLDSIVKCPLPLEVFDAFLAEYARTKNLDEARFFAQCEWDC